MYIGERKTPMLEFFSLKWLYKNKLKILDFFASIWYSLFRKVIFLFQLEEIPLIVKDLSVGVRTWEDVLNNYPIFEQQDATKEKWGWNLD